MRAHLDQRATVPATPDLSGVSRVRGWEREEVTGDVSQDADDTGGRRDSSGSLRSAGSGAPICLALAMKAGTRLLPRLLRAWLIPVVALVEGPLGPCSCADVENAHAGVRADNDPVLVQEADRLDSIGLGTSRCRLSAFEDCE